MTSTAPLQDLVSLINRKLKYAGETLKRQPDGKWCLVSQHDGIVAKNLHLWQYAHSLKLVVTWERLIVEEWTAAVAAHPRRPAAGRAARASVSPTDPRLERGTFPQMSHAQTTISPTKPRFTVFRRRDDAWLIALCDRHDAQLAALNALFDRYAPANPPELLREF